MKRFLLWALVPYLLAYRVWAAPEGQKSSTAQSKGFELYSWRDAKGDWMFALLPGTNRRKLESEIRKEPNRIPGVRGLEGRLMRLPKGETVFWVHPTDSAFAYPDGKSIRDIASSAARAQVDLQMPVPAKEVVPEEGAQK